MAKQVKVTSIETLDAFRSSLILFLSKAGSAVEEAGDEVRRTRVWLQQEQRMKWEGVLKRQRRQLEQAESELPGEFMDDYRRVVNSKGEDAMAEVTDGEYCGGCNRRLLPNQVAQVLSGATTACKPCGRLLYMPEDNTVGSS